MGHVPFSEQRNRDDGEQTTMTSPRDPRLDVYLVCSSYWSPIPEKSRLFCYTNRTGRNLLQSLPKPEFLTKFSNFFWLSQKQWNKPRISNNVPNPKFPNKRRKKQSLFFSKIFSTKIPNPFLCLSFLFQKSQISNILSTPKIPSAPSSAFPNFSMKISDPLSDEEKGYL